MLQIGQILNDTYRVDALLGEGGAGAVYVVFHLRMEARFALKVLSREGASPDLLTRFREEARLLASLDHPNIVRVIDWNSTADGRPYLVMELLPGEDLAHFLARAGALPPSVAIPIVLQIADALQFIHDQGVVHRDLKPANVFLCRNGPYPNFVKLLDFGIAKRLRSPSGLRTDRALLIGTPAYMSPEQVTEGAAHVDARTDQFALGLIAYEMLSGQPAFYRPGDELVVILTRVLTFTPPLLSDPQLDAVIRRAIHKEQRVRFASVQDFAVALEAEQPRSPDAALGRTTRIPKLTEAELQRVPPPDLPPAPDKPALPPTTHAHGNGELQIPFSGPLNPTTPAASPALPLPHLRSERPPRPRGRRLLQGALLFAAAVALIGLAALRPPRIGAPVRRPPSSIAAARRTATPDPPAPIPAPPAPAPAADVVPPVGAGTTAAPARPRPETTEGESPDGTHPADPTPAPRKVRTYRVQLDRGDPLSREQATYIADCAKRTFRDDYHRFAGRTVKLSRTHHLRVSSPLPGEYADYLDDCLSRMSKAGLAVPAQARFQIVPVY